VALSTRLALESPLITTDVINMAVLPYLAVRHRAADTPTTVVNGVTACVGVLSEEAFVERVLAAAAAGAAAAGVAATSP
jgi:hypothetical protein